MTKIAALALELVWVVVGFIVAKILTALYRRVFRYRDATVTR
jgi:hypothetical protein